VNGILYFYNYTRPQDGVLGTAVLTNGSFTSFTGNTAQDMVNARRSLFQRIGQPTSDVNIYNSLNGWTNGVLFAADKPTTWE
jgi:hypothetical protein